MSPDARPKVLLVDDEARMRRLLALHLERGYDVCEASSGEEALERLEREPFDAVVLDILMPGADGREVCRRIRERHRVPVLMLTALGAVEDKLDAFEAGADDYLTKPFDPRELNARIAALIRRSRSGEGRPDQPQRDPAAADIHWPRLSIRPATREVVCDGRTLSLTPKEFDLLHFLASTPGQAHSRGALLQHVWKDAAYAETRTVDAHIKTLREKLGRRGAGAALRTVWGVGYKFDPSVLEGEGDS